MRQLTSHCWPGNVRELVNTVERTLIMTPGTLIQKFHVDPVPESKKHLGYPEVSLDSPLPEQVAALERDYIDRALKTYHGRISDVVAHSGLNPRTLYRKMKLYNLDKKDYR
jgi:DNA-binding NtrC family response regulator